MKNMPLALAVFLVFTATLNAGQVRVETPSAGPCGYCTVSLPENYDPEKLWPTVFCYHGRNGRPTTFPYEKFTDGKNFVLVGVDYYWNSMDTNSRIDRDEANAKQLVQDLSKKFSIHPNYVFLAGNSAGGFLASGIAEKDPSLWAGLMILGSGRYENLHKRPTLPGFGSQRLFGGFHIAVPRKKRTGLNGMPIYVGAGSSDENHKWAKWAVSYYKSRGASVIFETWSGGHGHYPETEILNRWFEEFGPLREAKAKTAQAEKAEERGDLGEAYQNYREAAYIPGDYALVQEAGQTAEEIKKKADDLFSEAEKASKEGRKQDAVKALRKASHIFRGCDFGLKAKSALVPILKKDNTNDTKANQLEKRARSAESKGDYLTAFKLYQAYLSHFQKAKRYPLVRKHFLELKEDPDIRKALENQREELMCQNWFNMAKNFLRAGKEKKAREYLQKILNRGESKWTDKARSILERIS